MSRRLDFPRRWAQAYRKGGIRGLLRHFVTLPRLLIPTKAGWVFFAFLLLILIFSYTTGNNLLFLLFSAMLSLMVFSGLLSEASLGKVEIRRSFAPEIFAERPFPVDFSFHNQARFVGAYAFAVRDPNLFETDRGPFVVHLAAGDQTRVQVKGRVAVRGRHRFPPYRLFTQYPFLLFTKIRMVGKERELLVYPAIRPVNLDLNRLFGDGLSGRRDRGDDGDSFSYLKEYEKGTPLRKIDWKKSARSEDLFTKEFERRESRKIAVSFRPNPEEDFEPGLITAASILVWLYRHDVPFKLLADLQPDRGYSATPARLRRSLRTLALYDKPLRPALPQNADRIIEVFGNGRHRIR